VKQYAEGKVPWTHLEANADPDNFQFVVVGDRTGAPRQGVFSNAVRQIDLMQPEFVVSVGDLINGQKKTDQPEEIDRMWDEFDAMVQRLDMPFFYVSGNHDCYNPLLGDKWTERLGPSYYSFKYKQVQFIVLNTMFILNEKNHWPGAHEKQLAFLKETIAAASDVRWTVLIVHHPLWNYKNEPEIPEKFRPTYDRWLEIENAMGDREFTLFAGHRHRYDYTVRNDHKYITLATTGGKSGLRGPDHRQFDHFLWVTMTDDGPIIANLLMDGVLDAEGKSTNVTKEKNEDS
jgi:3',5'-cyclic AMP phosphodiesterase CpdA